MINYSEEIKSLDIRKLLNRAIYSSVFRYLLIFSIIFLVVFVLYSTCIFSPNVENVNILESSDDYTTIVVESPKENSEGIPAQDFTALCSVIQNKDLGIYEQSYLDACSIEPVQDNKLQLNFDIKPGAKIEQIFYSGKQITFMQALFRQ